MSSLSSFFLDVCFYCPNPLPGGDWLESLLPAVCKLCICTTPGGTISLWSLEICIAVVTVCQQMTVKDFEEGMPLTNSPILLPGVG